MSHAEQPDGYLDDIPVFVGPPSDRTVAGVLVRAGVGDEELATHGITHLAERILMSRHDQRCGAFSSHVGSQLTVFETAGTPEEVGAFLDRLNTSWLQPPYELVDSVAVSIRTSRSDRGGILGAASSARFGPKGIGLRARPEYALDHPDAHLLHRWLSEYFTSGNAAIYVNGTLPVGTRFRLPAGPRREPQAPVPLSTVYPAVSYERILGVGFSVVAPLSPAFRVAWIAFCEQLRTVLVDERSMATTVVCDFDDLDGHHVHAGLWTDGVGAQNSRVRDLLQTELQRLRWEGLRPGMLERARSTALQAATDARAAARVAADRAKAHLMGVSAPTPAETVGIIDGLDEVQAVELLEAAIERIQWIVSLDVGWTSRREVVVPGASARQVHGTLIRPLHPEDQRVLVTAPEGLTLQYADGRPTATVWFDDVAAMLAHPDGSRTLVALDATSLCVEATQWPDAPGLVRFIDARVRDDRVVRTLDNPGV